MRLVKYFLVFFFIQLTNCSDFQTIKRRLLKDGNQLSIKRFVRLPDALDYANRFYLLDTPSKGDYSSQLTKVIREWTPELLSMDPTSPYYFASDEGENLLSYLEAVRKNETILKPLLTVLPNSYRYAIPLFSVFECDEYITGHENNFFHNAQLLVGPGQSELEFQHDSGDFTQFFCSVYGWPQLFMVRSTYGNNSKELRKKGRLQNAEFFMNVIDPGSCIFIPADLVLGASLNNSISIVLTLKKIDDVPRTDENPEPFNCSATQPKTLDELDFQIQDTLNMTEIGLIIYFYQYLNPPAFDYQLSPTEFLNQFRQDKNASQLVMKWTPELIKLIEEELFQQLDLNQDGIFNIKDYKSVKNTHLVQLQQSLLTTLEKLRQIVISQYNEFNEKIKKMTEQLMANAETSTDSDKILASFLESMPQPLKEQLRESNDEIRKYLDKVEKPKTKPKSTTSTRTTDQDILFDNAETKTEDLDENQIKQEEEEEEEEIIAEPFHTDL